MALLADDIGWVSEKAHLELLRLLIRSNCIDGRTGEFVKGRLDSEKGKTAFAVYRSVFWEFSRERLKEMESEPEQEVRLRRDALGELLADSRKMDFVVTASMQRLGPIFITRDFGDSIEIENWSALYNRSHLEYVLFNY